MKRYLFFLPLLLVFSSCGKQTYVVEDTSVVAGYSGATSRNDNNESQQVLKPVPLAPLNSAYVPMATAFRMSGDYQDNVAVTLDASGNLVYFPAPTDITADSRPIDLGNGWWLNRQGLGQNSVFTKYTFAEYAELPEVPSVSQLKNAILPNAHVTQMIELPWSVNESLEKLPEIKAYLNNR